MKKAIFIISVLLLTAIVVSSFVSDTSDETPTFKEVVIGTQVWMVENLNVDKFRNGDPIPQVKTAEEWILAGQNKQPAWCYYDNDPKNGEKYGKLYNWYAVNDPRGLAPSGWHIPSNDEWDILTAYLEGQESAGHKMKSTLGWNNDGNGNNKSGFSGLPGGLRNDAGIFKNEGFKGYWWSSTGDEEVENIVMPEIKKDGDTSSYDDLGVEIIDGKNAWFRHLFFNQDWFYDNGWTKDYGHSVRCLNDQGVVNPRDTDF